MMPTPADPELVELDSGAVVSRWVAPHPRSVVVLQHGFGEHVGRFVTQHHQLVGHLLTEGHEVWGSDLLGHGRSPGRRAVTDVHRAVDDHRQVRDLATTGVPLFLIGHSLGGLVTAASVVADPDGVHGAVLLSPALPSAPSRPARVALALLGAVVPTFRLTVIAQPLSGLARTSGHQAATLADPLMDTGALTVRTGASALDVAAELWPRLATWQTPTLVMHGTADRYTDPADSKRFVEQIGRDDVELRTVDGALHELLADLDGDAVLDTVLTWLRERREPGARGSTPA